MTAFPYDKTIVALTQTSPASVGDVVRILQRIDAECVQGDGLKWFNALYLDVTNAVQSRIAQGGLGDGAWLARLDVEFAKLYLEALGSHLQGVPSPSCWNVFLDVRTDIRLERIQFAMAGINAHINHDLPKAIVATARATGTPPVHGSPQYRDYTAVNATLEQLIDTAKQTLRVRLLGDSLPPVSHVENTIAGWKVTAAREGSWRNSELLWHLQAVPALSESFLNTLDGLTTVVGKALLVPVPVVV